MMDKNSVISMTKKAFFSPGSNYHSQIDSREEQQPAPLPASSLPQGHILTFYCCIFFLCFKCLLFYIVDYNLQGRILDF